MKYIIDNIEYDVIIIRKANKNTYIRVKEDLKIYVTTSYLITNNQIKKILDSNYSYLIKMLNKRQVKKDKDEKFYFLGKPYDIIFMPNTSIDIYDNRIYAQNQNQLNKWLNKKTEEIFTFELNKIYNYFDEKIPFPKLKIRKMKTRWGVCNKKDNSVTLNFELIKYDLTKLDYVIVHELSHFIHFNHSASFWKLVEKYCENYKQIRKQLKE
ncbi:MAG: DUF45 domain-containing protein [Bacilli bacterium]|nr:DUF45 domain-containing protein [Bacilli bacterium]